MALTRRELLTGLPMITASALFMQMLDSTILNTALPTIAEDMHRSPFSMQLAVISYSLTVALLIPLSGWLADRFGTRRTFLGAVAVFSLGSLFCALSTTLPQLVASRVAQGIGGAMMVPVSRLTLMQAYQREDFVRVFTFITIPGQVGPILGPLLGGWLVTYASWHWIFLINIPFGLLGILYGLRVFPDFRQQRGPFDIAGFLLIGMGLFGMTAGLELTGGKTASPGLAVLLIALAFLCLTAYIVHARKAPFPLIRLGVFKIRTFSVGLAGNVVARLGIGSIPFLVPLFLQVGLGYPPDIAGMLMLAPAVASLMTKTFVLRVLSRFGFRRTLLFLTLSIGCVFAAASLQQPGWSLLPIIVQLFIQGMLMSAQFTAMNTITLGNIPPQMASDGNSLLSVSQNLCLSFGVAISTASLRLFSGSGTPLQALHSTFIAVGAMTAAAAFVFMLLRPEDGNRLLPSSLEEKARADKKERNS